MTKKVSEAVADGNRSADEVADEFLEILDSLFPELSNFVAMPPDQRVRRAANGMKVVNYIHDRWDRIWSNLVATGLAGKVWEAQGFPAEPPPIPPMPGSVSAERRSE